MKRVLLLTQYYPPENGAAQVRLGALTGWLNQHHVQVEVICPFPNYPEGKVHSKDKGKSYEKSTEVRFGAQHIVHRFWLYTAMGKGILRLLAYLSFCVMSFFALRKIQKPDLVVVNSGPLFLALPGIFFAWYFAVPVNLIIADIWPRSLQYIGGNFAGNIFLWMMRQMETWAYRHADGVTAVTQGIFDYLRVEEKISVDKIYFLPNGVDLQLFHSDAVSKRDELNIPQDDFMFIYPGNMGNAHALEFVLEAAHVLQNRKLKFHFLFVGGGSEKPKLMELKERLQLQNVTFLESVPMEQLVHYIRAADCGLIYIKLGLS